MKGLFWKLLEPKAEEVNREMTTNSYSQNCNLSSEKLFCLLSTYTNERIL